MSDNGTPTSEITLEQLAARIAQVNELSERAQAEAAALRAENARLSSRLARLEGNEQTPTTSAQPSPPVAAEGEADIAAETDRKVSRRGAMKALGAAAAGGVGLAVGSVLITEMPAAAADGANLVLGQAATNASTTQTTLTDSDPSGSHSALYTVLGAASGSGLLSASLFGDSSTTNGVIGSTSAGGNANGVQGIDVSTAGTAGVYGQSTNGIGVTGKGLTGIYGQCTTTSAPLGHVLAGIVGAGKALAPGIIAVGDTGPVMQMLPLADMTNTLPANPIAGQFVVLNNGSLWYCAVNGQWAQLNNTQKSLNLLPAPVRVFDSRVHGAANLANPNRPAGLVPVGTSSLILTIAANPNIAGVPASAVGVVGNVASANAQGPGFLSLYPAGAAPPSTATVNYVSDPISNSCIAALGTAPGSVGKLAFVVGTSATNVIFDVVGYLL